MKKKRTRSRRPSFDFTAKLNSSKFRKSANFKDLKNMRYKYLFSENYKPIEKLVSDSKLFFNFWIIIFFGFFQIFF